MIALIYKKDEFRKRAHQALQKRQQFEQRQEEERKITRLKSIEK
jgi:hypothetical protein